MSVRRQLVRLTSRARRDFEQILVYSRRTWGDDRTATYRSTLSGALRTIGEYPHLGRTRDEHFAGCRSHQVEQHVIYDRIEADTVVVIRMLHSRQDATGQLGEPPQRNP